MNVLVTGGAGFIGSHIVDRLIDLGHSVICIDNESSECHDKFFWNSKANNYKLDICDYDSISNLFFGIDCVFHVASDARIQPAILDPKKSVYANVIGTTNVLELSRLAKVKRFIYSSTSSAYGKKSNVPNVETQPSDPLTPYSTAKVFGENLARVYYNLYGLETISLRYFNVYGDRQPLRGKYAPVIGLFLKQLKNKEPLTIVGDGSQKRDFTYVKDVVEANILSMQCNLDSYGEVFNVGYGKSYSILEIASFISDKVQFIPPRPGESRETLSNTDKIKTAMGWQPEVSLDCWIRDQIGI